MNAQSMPAAAEPTRSAVGGLDEDERAALRYATMPALVHMERLELLHFLRYPADLPQDKLTAVVERILERRGITEKSPATGVWVVYGWDMSYYAVSIHTDPVTAARKAGDLYNKIAFWPHDTDLGEAITQWEKVG